MMNAVKFDVFDDQLCSPNTPTSNPIPSATSKSTKSTKRSQKLKNPPKAPKHPSASVDSPEAGQFRSKIEGISRKLEHLDKLEVFVQQELRRIYNEDIEYIGLPLSTSDLIKRIIEESQGISVFTTVDLGRLISQAVQWKKYLPRIQPFYAVKANPDLNILRTLFLLGVNFDCASKGEIEMVLNLGAEPNQIIFANPAKGFDHIQYSKAKDVRLMTFDNMAELKKILNMFPEAELVLRISSNDTMSLLPFGFKFGARREDACQLIAACAQLKANLVGISFHVGSGCYSSVGFIDTIHRAREMFNEAEKHGFRLTLLDIGGGFPGDTEGSITFADIASDIGPVIDNLFPEPDIQVIAEPGRYFCTSTINVALQVYAKRDYISRRVDPDTKECHPIKEIQYYCPDGVYGNFNNIIYDHATPICHPLVEPPLDTVLYNSTFFGPTCDSIDVIAKNISFPPLELGDWVYFTNMGAYTTAAGSCFNGIERPPIFYKILDQGDLKDDRNI
eukprot:TRINITY_DN24859_c0_g1_i1.p1 TRINITY_DN24859_c0_g1~~TRINITY_DN24859_c0_g1_i1.p1  ORF type:complete len:504 (+),score=80.50 TRINITY_DN24859_c0_g1_i1:91-1602(+)